MAVSHMAALDDNSECVQTSQIQSKLVWAEIRTYWITV